MSQNLDPTYEQHHAVFGLFLTSLTQNDGLVASMLLSMLALLSVSSLKFSVPRAAHRFEAGKYASPFFLTQVLILLCLLSSLFLTLARKGQ